MSEFSSSYHFKTDDRAKAVELIKNSGNRGFAFEETNGWVSFLIEGPLFDIHPSVIQSNPGLIVHYMYAEDHGWQFRVFNKQELAFEYKCDWTDEIVEEKTLFDLTIIKELIASHGNSSDGIEELFDISKYDFEEQPAAYTLAEELGLIHYQWLSADDIGNLADDSLIVE
ncbi:hypothetical protein ACFQZE_14875 [Paenibacillus sp. GCM10027627]|uniref:hypothetical protein n=1 Tax=unclassified Paenibacillus TaxID=185978 RepID=UPI00362C201B